MNTTDLLLVGCTVHDVRRAGRQVEVALSAGRLVIEAPFTVTTSRGIDRIDPDDPASGDGRYMDALRGRAVLAATSTGGNLRVECDGGIRLAAPADADFEAWHLHGPDDRLVVSMPGGELAIWSGAGR